MRRGVRSVRLDVGVIYGDGAGEGASVEGGDGGVCSDVRRCTPKKVVRS
jgi:hypothetical protein